MTNRIIFDDEYFLFAHVGSPDVNTIIFDDEYFLFEQVAPPGITLGAPASAYPGEGVNLIASGDVSGTGDEVTFVTIGGVTQTLGSLSYDSEDDETTIPITVVQSNLKFSAGYAVIATLASTDTLNTTIELVAKPGNAYTNVVAPSTEEGSVFHEHLGSPPQIGDQVEQDDSPNTVVLSNGFIEQDEITNFNVRLWRSGSGTWSNWGEIKTFEVEPE